MRELSTGEVVREERSTLVDGGALRFIRISESDREKIRSWVRTHDEAMVDSMHRVLRLDGGTLTVLS